MRRHRSRLPATLARVTILLACLAAPALAMTALEPPSNPNVLENAQQTSNGAGLVIMLGLQRS